MHLALFTTFLPNILICPPNIFDKSTPVMESSLYGFEPTFIEQAITILPGSTTGQTKRPLRTVNFWFGSKI